MQPVMGAACTSPALPWEGSWPEQQDGHLGPHSWSCLRDHPGMAGASVFPIMEVTGQLLLLQPRGLSQAPMGQFPIRHPHLPQQCLSGSQGQDAGQGYLMGQGSQAMGLS